MISYCSTEISIVVVGLVINNYHVAPVVKKFILNLQSPLLRYKAVVDSAKVNPVPSGATGIGKPSASLIEANLYPNPTAGKTTVSYGISSKAPVAITLYDVAGRLVGTVLEEPEQIPGTYRAEIETTGLESGLYFVRIRSGSYETTLRLMIRQ